jgi:maltose alpha-D-glucosyltransferase/alpha-amylase
VVRYGEEIGMGDDLSLPERDSVRTPMQWSEAPNGGFSTAPAEAVHRPVIADGPFGYPEVNVTAQRRDPHSLLSWMERALHTLRECPEFAIGRFEPLDTTQRSVVALRYEAPSGVMLALTNLVDQPCVIDLADQVGELPDAPTEIFGDGDYGDPRPDPSKLELNGYGYRWIRLRQSIGSE